MIDAFIKLIYSATSFKYVISMYASIYFKMSSLLQNLH